MKFLNETDYLISKKLSKFLFVSMLLAPFAKNGFIRAILLTHIICMLLFSILVLSKWIMYSIRKH